MGDKGGSLWCPNNNVIICHLVATLLTVTWHLDLLSENQWGGGELSHFGSSSPVSVCGCWPSFVSSGVVCVHSWAFFIVWGCWSWLLWLVTWHCHVAVGGCVLCL